MGINVEYPKAMGLGKLETIAFLTMLLVFGFIVFIFGAALWWSGVSGFTGILMAFVFSGIVILIQWYLGPILIKSMTNMREIKENEYPEIYSMVRRISRDAGIPMPKLYLVYNSEPNAFAFGRTQSTSNIAIHTGLLNVLNKEEIEGVIAHEIGHIKHKDVAVMTVASMIPILLYYLVIVATPKDNRESPAWFFVVYIGAMIAQFIGQLIVLWLSRKREYYADAFSAYVTKNPIALMSGLAKITYGLGMYKTERRQESTNNALKCFYISYPEGDENVTKIANIARAIDAKNAEEIERAIDNERKMLGGELLRTHPFTANRLFALWNIEKELHKYRSVGVEY